jgi:hypothetical protein
MRAQINEIETKKKKKQRINETKSLFFGRMNNIDKPLANLTEMRREETQINKIENKKEYHNKHQRNPENH